MARMSTKAGKRLTLDLGLYGKRRQRCEDYIAAIEAEARAAVLRELREEVAEMAFGLDGVMLDTETVLAAIDRRLGDD
jgi:hypothetical protein